jgi:hypothetical protein
MRRMRLACSTTKATETYPEYVILISVTWSTMVMRTRLSVMLYVYYLSCFFCGIYYVAVSILHSSGSKGRTTGE